MNVNSGNALPFPGNNVNAAARRRNLTDVLVKRDHGAATSPSAGAAEPPVISAANLPTNESGTGNRSGRDGLPSPLSGSSTRRSLHYKAPVLTIPLGDERSIRSGACVCPPPTPILSSSPSSSDMLQRSHEPD